MRNVVFLPFATLGAIAMFAGQAQADPFSGPYVGASVGFDRDVIGPNLFDGPRLDRHALKSSADFEAFAGQNYRISTRFVVSPELGINFSTSDVANGTSGANLVKIDPKRQFEASLRVGYLVTGKTLVYARGGYSNLRARVEVSNAINSAPISSASRDLDGYLVGGGAEYAVFPKVTARIEYRYNDFKEDGGEFQRHQALVGLAYHF